MIKTLTAGLVALSLTLGTVAPNAAHAEIDEGEAIVGIITLLLLGAAIANDNDNDRSPGRGDRPRDNSWRLVPAECLRTIETRRGDTVRMFPRRCMERNYAHVNRLPSRCEITVRNARGHLRHGWTPRCLRQAGFRRDDRH